MMGHGTKFGKRRRDNRPLLSQRTSKRAARLRELGTKTLLRWLQLPESRSGSRLTHSRHVPSNFPAVIRQDTDALGPSRGPMIGGGVRQRDRDTSLICVLFQSVCHTVLISRRRQHGRCQFAVDMLACDYDLKGSHLALMIAPTQKL